MHQKILSSPIYIWEIFSETGNSETKFGKRETRKALLPNVSYKFFQVILLKYTLLAFLNSYQTHFLRHHVIHFALRNELIMDIDSSPPILHE